MGICVPRRGRPVGIPAAKETEGVTAAGNVLDATAMVKHAALTHVGMNITSPSAAHTGEGSDPRTDESSTEDAPRTRVRPADRASSHRAWVAGSCRSCQGVSAAWCRNSRPRALGHNGVANGVHRPT